MLAGPVSKAMILVGRDAGGQQRQIADAAEVEQDTMFLAMAKELVIKEWDEGRTLASGGDVGGTEVTDHGNSQGFSDG